MNSKNKWNKELFYATFFLVAGITWFFFNPYDELAELIFSTQNILEKVFGLGILPAFYHTADVSRIGLLFFLLCSIYVGIFSLRKASPDGERRISNFIPKNAPGFSAVLLIFISTFLVISALTVLDF